MLRVCLLKWQSVSGSKVFPGFKIWRLLLRKSKKLQLKQRRFKPNWSNRKIPLWMWVQIKNRILLFCKDKELKLATTVSLGTASITKANRRKLLTIAGFKTSRTLTRRRIVAPRTRSMRTYWLTREERSFLPISMSRVTCSPAITAIRKFKTIHLSLRASSWLPRE